jgi:hypothetical protein
MPAKGNDKLIVAFKKRKERKRPNKKKSSNTPLLAWVFSSLQPETNRSLAISLKQICDVVSVISRHTLWKDVSRCFGSVSRPTHRDSWNKKILQAEMWGAF